MNRIASKSGSWALLRHTLLSYCSCSSSFSVRSSSPTSASNTAHRPFSSTTTSSAPTPPFSYTSLPSRSVLSIGGQDVDKFLQGLITNDIARLGSKPHEALYAGVLKADGRALHDLFIYPSPTPSSTSTYLLDHPSDVSDTFRKYLKRHILRSKVKLAPSALTTESVQAAWKTSSPTDSDQETELMDQAQEWLETRRASRDMRDDAMGWRWVANQEKEAESAPPSDLFQLVTPSHHHLHRLLLGIPEGQADLASLPLEGNLDLLNAIDFQKGCYVGQELTARTYHRGVVRKRQVPVRLFREGEEIPDDLFPSNLTLRPYPDLFPLPPPGSTLTPPSIVGTRSASRQSGRLHSSLPVVTPYGSSFALGLATIRLDQLEPGAVDRGVFVVKAEMEEGAEVGWGAGETDEEGGRWLAKGFVREGGWLEKGLEEEKKRKGGEEEQ